MKADVFARRRQRGEERKRVSRQVLAVDHSLHHMLEQCYHMPDEMCLARKLEGALSTNARLDDREAMRPASRGVPDLCPFLHESTHNARFNDSMPALSAPNASCDEFALHLESSKDGNDIARFHDHPFFCLQDDFFLDISGLYCSGSKFRSLK